MATAALEGAAVDETEGGSFAAINRLRRDWAFGFAYGLGGGRCPPPNPLLAKGLHPLQSQESPFFNAEGGYKAAKHAPFCPIYSRSF